MPTITPDLHIQIVRFKIAPEKADGLIEAVRGELGRWVSHCDGFVSSTFHKSEDGQHVINYAQWRDRAAFDAFLQHEEQQALRKVLGAAGAGRAEADSFDLIFTVER
ncbi:antibiotic biosynthesis monooxygenase [Parvularcula sp. ZS-1/3]|uniref:Antibiotic biosynthesis monooxygenase n=1 Tax=Parvularcula mediterranea TaxID=2732508 RepID=A0A7Y3W4E1_9PROT|nr:antibiotic biosynthesis monooxygenase family protein [Parvularcula mediterranea]NNU15141.1 antibiotic biosynthesis monooxygenase [Parvularcula mediterranea]